MIQRDVLAIDEAVQEACVLPRVIFIRATMSGLFHPLVPFILLKEDPLIKLQEYIKLYSVDTRDSRLIRALWNKSFSTLSKDSIYFVYAWNSVPEATPQILKAAGMTFVIGSCGPQHKRWLTTRPMERDGEFVAWCVEIDMHEPQFERVVVLSEKNMIGVGLVEEEQ